MTLYCRRAPLPQLSIGVLPSTVLLQISVTQNRALHVLKKCDKKPSLPPLPMAHMRSGSLAKSRQMSHIEGYLTSLCELELTQLILAQKDRWPGNIRWNPSKITTSVMRAELANPQNRFDFLNLVTTLSTGGDLALSSPNGWEVSLNPDMDSIEDIPDAMTDIETEMDTSLDGNLTRSFYDASEKSEGDHECTGDMSTVIRFNEDSIAGVSKENGEVLYNLAGDEKEGDHEHASHVIPSNEDSIWGIDKEAELQGYLSNAEGSIGPHISNFVETSPEFVPSVRAIGKMQANEAGVPLTSTLLQSPMWSPHNAGFMTSSPKSLVILSRLPRSGALTPDASFSGGTVDTMKNNVPSSQDDSMLDDINVLPATLSQLSALFILNPAKPQKVSMNAQHCTKLTFSELVVYHVNDILAVEISTFVETLQHSACSVDGAAHLAFCVPGNDTFIPFAKINHHFKLIPGVEDTLISIFEQEVMLSLPVDCTETLPTTVQLGKRSLPAMSLDSFTVKHRLPSGKQDAGPAVKLSPEADAAIVARIVQNMESHDDGNALSNHDLYWIYHFAGVLVKIWHHQKVDIKENSTLIRCCVKIFHIHRASGRATTWWADAHSMIELINKLGSDAAHPDPETVLLLNTNEKQGLKKLLTLLEQRRTMLQGTVDSIGIER
ncbi:hypothetical protein BKA93DRAFT_748085 [Sparassis latifolia]